MNVSTCALEHLLGASVLFCGFGSTAGENDTPTCGLQLVTETPVMTPDIESFCTMFRLHNPVIHVGNISLALCFRADKRKLLLENMFHTF